MAPRASVWVPRTSTRGAHKGNGLGSTAKYLRRTTSPAAENGLGTTIKYLRDAAGVALGTSVNYLGRTTRQRHGHYDQLPATQNIGAGGSGLGTMAKYLRRKTNGAANNGLSR